MKKLTILAALAALLALPCYMGCSSMTPAQTAVVVIDTSIPLAVQFDVQQRPGDIPYFNAAVAAIQAVAQGTNFNTATLSAAIDGIPGATNNLAASLIIRGGIALYDGLFASGVTSNADAVAILNALATSISAGLPPNNPQAMRMKVLKLKR